MSHSLSNLSLSSNQAPWRDVTLWFLNDILDPDELRHGVHALKAAGFGSAILRSFNGLATPYLSEPFFDAHGAVLDEAAKVGLKIWLQAGHMPSMVPDLPDQHCMQILAPLNPDEPAQDGDTLVAQFADTRVVRRRKPRALHLLDVNACKYYVDLAYEQTWMTRFASHFGKTVDAIWVDEPSLEKRGFPWSDELEHRLLAQTGLSREAAIQRLFNWSPDSASVRYHFRRIAMELLLHGYFHTVQKWSVDHGVWFAGHLMGEDSLRTQTVLAGACMPCYPYMGVIGVDHLTGSERWGHLNEMKHWLGRAPLFLMTPLQAVSVARQLGKPRILAEMYGVSDQHFPPAQQKRIGEFLFAQGIDLRCLHGTPVSLRGRRKRIYPPALSPHQPWWPAHRDVSDHFATLTAALTTGEPDVDALVLHPVETAWMYAGPQSIGSEAPVDEADQRLIDLDRDFCQLLQSAAAAGLCVELGDESIMAEHARVDGKTLHVGQRAYNVVILPPMATLRASTLQLLEQFLRAGGRVLRIGESLPQFVDGQPDQRPATLLRNTDAVSPDPSALRAWFDQHIPQRIRLVAPPLPTPLLIQRRRLNDNLLLFIANSNDQTAEASLTIPGHFSATRLDPATQQPAALAAQLRDGATHLQIALPPLGSALITAQQVTAAHPLAPTGTQPTATHIDLPSRWSVTRLDPNALVLDFARARCGDGPWSDLLPLPGIEQMLIEDKRYRGPLTLRFEFAAEPNQRRVGLVAETLDRWRITLNGQPLTAAPQSHWIDRRWRPVDVTALLSEQNVLEMSCDYEPVIPASPLADRFATLPGIELENVYLIGDFAVAADFRDADAAPGILRMRNPRITCETSHSTGALTTTGYPFFAGRIALTQEFDAPSITDGARALLRLDPLLTASIRVFINDADAGAILFPPYTLDITRHLRAGRNALRLELATSLRNLLGPLHRPPGMREATWTDSFSGRHDRDSRQSFPNWYTNRTTDTSMWSDDYFLINLALGAATLELRH